MKNILFPVPISILLSMAIGSAWYWFGYKVAIIAFLISFIVVCHVIIRRETIMYKELAETIHPS